MSGRSLRKPQKCYKMQKPKINFVYYCCAAGFFTIWIMVWARPVPSTPDPLAPGALPVSSCDGRRVYSYNLPSSFNTQLLEKCYGDLVSWIYFCEHHQNYGFGAIVDSTVDIFRDDWYRTDAYMLEVIFFERMQTYTCLTKDPSQADLFFIPYFAGLDALPYLYGSKRGHRHGRNLIAWMAKNATETWRRHGGQDHFLIAGRTAWDFSRQLSEVGYSWGTTLFNEPEMANVTSLVLERKPWMTTEQAIPYPVGFHPSSTASLRSWIKRVESSTRKYLFSFSGSLRPNMTGSIRGILSQQCLDAGTACIRLDCAKIKCSHEPEPIYKKLLEADFCLQPRGDTATRRAVIDSILSGCIPVLFHRDTAHTEYTWHLPSDFEAYSVFINEQLIKDGTAHVQHILEAYSPVQVESMRKRLISIMPNLMYRHPSGIAMAETMRDAFDISIDGMARKVASMKAASRSPNVKS